MEILYIIIFFILGTLMGSFYTVVGLRLPKGEDCIKSRSYCDHCHHTLSLLDMIPIVSYYLLGKKCRYCGASIDSLSTSMEFFTGVLFALSYFVFGFSYDLFIAIGIVSMLSIISVSDITYLIIPDEVLIFFSGYFLVIAALQYGVSTCLLKIFSGLCLFGIMYLVMLMGNYLFKKESLGGGDIKMMFVFGILLHPVVGLLVIFISSVLALPISLFLLYSKGKRIIPFGPFLLIGLTLVFFMGISFNQVLDFIKLL